jgi:hypothetical protein
MPVPAQVGCRDRDDDQMPFADADLAVATGTHVGLTRFIGLHASYLDVVVAGALHDWTR